MKRYFDYVCALAIPFVLFYTYSPLPVIADEAPPPYKDTQLDFKARAQDLVARMTSEEKISQLVNDAPAIPRLGVREYNWWNEGLHGVAGAGYATVFPQAIGMAATWNVPLMKEVADVISIEFRAKHLAEQHRFGGSDWFAGLTVWSPNINIFRDPRWGRGQETYGEDPFLTSRLGVAFIQGLQGDDARYLRTVATPKHFAVHSGPEANRHKEDVHPSARDLEETYLPAFKAAIKEGAATSIMCAYNAVDGVPACASEDLLQNTLREQWQFDGYVVSDCEAVADIYKPEHHNYKPSPAEGIAAAFNAGMDLVCGSADEIPHIAEALNKGLVTQARLDQALVRLFSARFRLGQFDPRADVFPSITAKDYDTEENRALSLRMAEESLVLLKNTGNILPLSSKAKKIALIGPNADSYDALVGNYNGSPSEPITVLDGMTAQFGAQAVAYEPGTTLLSPVQYPIPESALCLDARCKKHGLHAEIFDSKAMAGAPTTKAEHKNAELQWHGEMKTTAVRWQGFLQAPETGTYTFRYEANGGYRVWIGETLVVDAWGVDWRPSLASGAIDLKKGKRYALKVESFQREEQGDERLVWSLPSDPGAEKALSAAKKADVVVFVAGLTAQVEGEEIPVDVSGFSGGDRTHLKLPEPQVKLLDRLLALPKPVVVVLMNGSAVSLNNADDRAAAIIEAWYPGGSGGEAIANVLAGEFSPAGRLPITFYHSVDDLPPFSDYSMANRTYRFFNGEALYPFGYGLSYTRFAYSKADVSPAVYRGEGTLQVSVQVENVGARDGDEVVQLYLSRPDIKDSPISALVGFKRIHLKKGEKKTVNFELDRVALSSVDAEGARSVLPGAATLWIGGGQQKVREGLVQPAGAAVAFSLSGR
ncbi:MAG TPA: glycoside hydrolase family 3 C-terminal domain-containing protein [Marinagarivorans sp.]